MQFAMVICVCVCMFGCVGNVFVCMYVCACSHPSIFIFFTSVHVRHVFHNVIKTMSRNWCIIMSVFIFLASHKQRINKGTVIFFLLPIIQLGCFMSCMSTPTHSLLSTYLRTKSGTY